MGILVVLTTVLTAIIVANVGLAASSFVTLRNGANRANRAAV
ncbi:MAG: hypothetical protein AAGC56_13870 [Pseudomonadota bacterium]